jgi:hypothetical protein
MRVNRQIRTGDALLTCITQETVNLSASPLFIPQLEQEVLDHFPSTRIKKASVY